jgi:hypothetical protein
MYVRRRQWHGATLTAALVVAAVAVTGCNSHQPKSVAITGSPGIGYGIRTKGEPAAAWVRRWNTIAVTVFGSSSCPPVPTHVRVDADQGLITVTISDNYKGPCTADLAPYTSVIELHQEMNAGHSTGVLIREKGRPDVRLRL